MIMPESAIKMQEVSELIENAPQQQATTLSVP